jgi:hypothetical protein
MLKGIDVGDAQPSIDWAKVPSQIDFAFLKATEGADFVAETFTRRRVQAVRNRDIAFGAYHYLRPRRDRNGAVEAEHFVKTVRDRGWKVGRDLPLVVDVEWINNEREIRAMSGAQLREYVSDFNDRTRQPRAAARRRDLGRRLGCAGRTAADAGGLRAAPRVLPSDQRPRQCARRPNAVRLQRLHGIAPKSEGTHQWP